MVLCWRQVCKSVHFALSCLLISIFAAAPTQTLPKAFTKIICTLNCLARADHGMRLHCTWEGAEIHKAAWAKCWMKVICIAVYFEAFFPEKLLTNILLLSPIYKDVIQLLCNFLLNVTVKHWFVLSTWIGKWLGEKLTCAWLKYLYFFAWTGIWFGQNRFIFLNCSVVSEGVYFRRL